MKTFSLPLCLIAITAGAGLTGCPMHDDTAETTSAHGEDSSATAACDGTDDHGSTDGSMDASATETGQPGTGGPAIDIAGISGRLPSAPIAPGNDGVGNLYVAALASCDLAAQFVGAAVLPNADASVADVPLPFEMTGLPPGPVFLAAFLDDDGNADQAMPVPGPGDLVFADIVQDGQLSCVEVNVVPGQTAMAEIWLNATVPL